METRASYALIGGFLLTAVAALAAFVIWLGQVQFQREYAEYDVIFEGAVNGLGVGGEVRYLGIKVGEVTDLSVDRQNDQNVIAHIRVDRDTPVRTDSSAILDFAGLTGVTFIQLRAGTPGAPFLERTTGVNVPSIVAERTQLEEIVAGGQDLIANAQITLAKINRVLDEENTESLKATLNNLETLTGTFAEDSELMTEAASALAALNRAGESVGKAADTFSDFGSGLGDQLDELSTAVSDLIADAQDVFTRANTMIDRTSDGLDSTRLALQEPTVEAMEEIRLTAQELRLLITRLDRVVRDIEENPQSFVLGDPKPYAEDQ